MNTENEKFIKVSATELADFVKCQKIALFKYKFKHGELETKIKPKAYAELPDLSETASKESIYSYIGRIRRAQGISVHNKYYENLERDARCFIATAIFGQEAWQTELLRYFRDKNLLSNSIGRFLVKVYYKVSPTLADYLQHNNNGFAFYIVKLILMKFIKIITWMQ